MKQLLVRPAAAADIEAAYKWYEQRQVGLGDEFLAAADKLLDDIAGHPLAYPVVHREARRALLHRFPYAIFYRIEGETILVVACMHGRRDPQRWKDRI